MYPLTTTDMDEGVLQSFTAGIETKTVPATAVKAMAIAAKGSASASSTTRNACQYLLFAT